MREAWGLLMRLRRDLSSRFSNIGKGIEAIEEAEFLSKEQKRDILYNNAVRFPHV